MRKWIAMLLILGAVLTLTAKDYELKQAVDKNGYTYSYVTEDP